MKISTCFWFDNQAEAAARFYISLFQDASLLGMSRYGPGAPLPEGTALVVDLELEGVRYQLLNGGPRFPQSEAASICVHCDTQAEIDRLWAALTAEGGKESRCGWLQDRWGVSWQILPARIAEWMSGDPARAARVAAAFMPMRKLDIATLEAAARG